MSTDNANNDDNASATTAVTPPSNLAYINLSNYMYYAYDNNTPFTSTLANEIGFTPWLGPKGNPLHWVNNATGLYAEAFVSTAPGPKQVIIAYEGTQLKQALGQGLSFTKAQITDDEQLGKGLKADSLAGAAAFATRVIAKVTQQGISEQNIYVTGHSLGGAEADYAASKTGLGGVTFAAPGINTAFTKPHPSNVVQNHDNVLNYIDAGDPIGNYAYDNGNTPLKSVLASDAIRHYGKIDVLPNATGEQSLEYYNGQYADAKTKLGKAYVLAEALHANGKDHLLYQYAADLGYSKELYLPDGSTNSAAGFLASASTGTSQASVDTSYIAAALTGGGASQSSSASSATSNASVLAASAQAVGVKAHAA